MNEGRGAAGQVGAALVLALAVVAVVVVVQGREETAAPVAKPAVCTPPKDTDAPGYPALCAALNRPDLASLVGAPGEHALGAHSAGFVSASAKDGKGHDPAAEVQLDTYFVRVADNGDLSLRTFTDLLAPTALPGSVLGHPAAAYADHTMSLAFNGKTTTTGTGGIARHLVVAKGPREDAGSYEVAVWRSGDGAVDDAAVQRVAEAVLPTLQGWVPGQP
ncbi:DUF6215 domain-containing protein [Streptomyces sp. SP17BM10]|uniref:DUF6215 domain-containing protein n=1 Tax=Streptomyces sp. SP17BM10 TaxID=3002530 RepID=UPI002E76575E|nr:DUF6215 domain-containing protein [Streptomyces sp. SP17BM10]MEE1782353.1 DUF6215 domain-containing protein [Streptomyces sp. SP17BM10]